METTLAPNEQRNNTEDATKGILTFLQEEEKKIKTGVSKNITLVLGFTGSGKSTFTQYITGNDDTLVAVETNTDTGEFIISDSRNKICASTIDSCTVIPEMFLDTRTNAVFYDCPGFSDTRSIAHDISVTYFIKKILNSADAVKLVFAVNYPSVREGVDRTNFMLLVKNILAMVKDVEKFSSSIALVVTKVDNNFIFRKGVPILVSDEKIIENIVKFLKGVRDSVTSKLTKIVESEENTFNQNVIKLLDIFTMKTGDQYERIGIFRRPNESGPIHSSPFAQENKVHLDKVIHNNLNFTSKQDEDFGYTVSADSLNIMHDLVGKVDKELGAEVARVGEKIKIHFQNQEFLLTSLDEQRSQYQTAAETLAALKTTDDLREPEDLAYRINTFVISGLNIQADAEMENIVRYDQFLKFLRTLKEQLTTHPLEWIKGLENSNEYIQGSKAWYELLTDLRTSLSRYGVVKELQKNRELTEDLKKRISTYGQSPPDGRDSKENILEGLRAFAQQVSSVDEVKHLSSRIGSAPKTALNSRKLSFLDDLLDFHVSFSCSSPNRLIVRGRFVKMSDILQERCNFQWTFLDIFGYEKVFFDGGLSAQGREAQVSIIAPTWEVVGRAEIALNGLPGKDADSANAGTPWWNGSNGWNGQSGGPGGSGGCFLGVARSCINCKNLIISVSGGNGGRGQDGGDGANGADFHHSYDGGDSGKLYLLVFNKATDDTVFEGQKGGDGGDGGMGGIGGLPGEIVTIMLNGGEGPIKKTSNGLQGANGSGGSPGMGGSTKRVTTKWKSVLFFPWESRDVKIQGRVSSGSWGSSGASRDGLRNPNTPKTLENPSATVENYKTSLSSFTQKTLTGSKDFLRDLEKDQAVRTLRRYRRNLNTSPQPTKPLSTIKVFRDAASAIRSSTWKWLQPSGQLHSSNYERLGLGAENPHLTSDSNGRSTVGGRVNYDLMSVTGNLLLLDLLIRKNLASKSKSERQASMDGFEDNEFAQKMAYRAYVPSNDGRDVSMHTT